jgi:hypothetical protein
MPLARDGQNAPLFVTQSELPWPPPPKECAVPLEGAWRFLAALPSVRVARVAQAGDLALLSQADLAAVTLLERGRVDRYLGRFSTPLNDQLQPSVVIARRGATVHAQDIARLRDVVAVASVVRARTWRLVHHGQGGPTFTDAFDFARISLRIGPGLYVETPAVLVGGGGPANEAFAGQGSAVYPTDSPDDADVDEWLLEPLLELLQAEPRRRADRSRRDQLLRSVEVAAHAMRAPSYGLEPTATDSGVLLSLWVAAFETLVNAADRVGFRHVKAAIERVPWRQAELTTATVRHDSRSPSVRDEQIRQARNRPNTTPADVREVSRGQLVTRPVHVYSRLYRARNATMHGEILGRGGLEPGRRRTWGPIHHQAAALYRCVLFHEVSVGGYGSYPRVPLPLPAPWTEQQLGEHMAAHRDAGLAHETYEEALLKNYARRQ